MIRNSNFKQTDPSLSKEDLEQELLLYAINKMRTFNPDLGVKPITYVYGSTRFKLSKLINSVQTRNSKKNTIPTPKETFLHFDEIVSKDFIENALKNSEDRELFLEYHNGSSIKDLSDKTGKPVNQVRQKINKCRDLLMKAMAYEEHCRN